MPVWGRPGIPEPLNGDLSTTPVLETTARQHHTRLGNPSNAPETYSLDGHQYLLTATGDTLYAFTLY